MDHRIAWPRPWGRVLSATAAAAALVAAATLLSAPPALAQGKPAAKPAAPAAQPAGPQVREAKQLVYSPWTKACQKGKATNNLQVCVVHTDGRAQNGQLIVAAQVIEPEGRDKKLQVVIGATVAVQRGTRILIDHQEAGKAPYQVCGALSGCVAFYNADDKLIAALKKGKTLEVQTFVPPNTIVSFPFSLENFAKAYDGPPIDPKALAARQRKLQEELQKKAEAARKRLEAQKPAAAPAPKK